MDGWMSGHTSAYGFEVGGGEEERWFHCFLYGWVWVAGALLFIRASTTDALVCLGFHHGDTDTCHLSDLV